MIVIRQRDALTDQLSAFEPRWKARFNTDDNM